MNKTEKWYVITGIVSVVLFLLCIGCSILFGITVEIEEDAMKAITDEFLRQRLVCF